VVDHLLRQLALIHVSFTRNTEGISQEESLRQPQEGGNCLNWVAGHMVASRDIILGILGQEKVWGETEEERYARGSEPITSSEDALSFAKIQADFETAQRRIVAGLRSISPEALAAPAPFSVVGDPDEKVISLLASLIFHDAYHVGQTGTLRRFLGQDGAIS